MLNCDKYDDIIISNLVINGFQASQLNKEETRRTTERNLASFSLFLIQDNK